MKTIQVVAAIIKNKDGEIFATQRGYGEFEGLWEFPGGKIEVGERSEEALIREIQEELGINILVKDFLCVTEYDYPNFHLRMECYICEIDSGYIELKEHKSAQWLTVDTLDRVEWLPADIKVIEALKVKNN
ncbi:MAG: 8-oxo-dGTP diphosphatase MutT [Bacteroidaceae bacterium]|nr:8-oxo-dGTP diphosphatase MutT [Bacteroidaceae bacterium]